MRDYLYFVLFVKWLIDLASNWSIGHKQRKLLAIISQAIEALVPFESLVYKNMSYKMIGWTPHWTILMILPLLSGRYQIFNFYKKVKFWKRNFTYADNIYVRLDRISSLMVYTQTEGI